MAILSVLSVVFGQGIHLFQHHSGACHTELLRQTVSSEAQPTAVAYEHGHSCPFHHHAVSNPAEGSPAQNEQNHHHTPHRHSDCPVCEALAIGAVTIPATELLSEAVVVQSVEFWPEQAFSDVLQSIPPARGPPVWL